MDIFMFVNRNTTALYFRGKKTGSYRISKAAAIRRQEPARVMFVNNILFHF